MNIEACCRNDRYSVEVLVPSLFQDRAASWVRIANGIVKYVTESMLTKEEDDTASVNTIAKARPRQKPTVMLTSVSILVREREWIGIETPRSHDHKCFEVSKTIPDCYDMIKQSLEEVTEQSTAVTSSKSAGGRSSMVLRDGHLKIGYKLWQKVEELRKDVNVA